MIMQRKVEGSRILTPGVNLGTLWAKTDTRACGAPKVFSGVLRCSYLTGIHQGSWSKLTLYQWCWWVPNCTEVMETKANTKLKRKKKTHGRTFSFILARSSPWLNTSAVFPLKTQHFGWCENLCQEITPREQNMYQVIMDVINRSNICLLFFFPLTLIQP